MIDPEAAARALGVAAGAGPAEVEAAYRRLVRLHHPDRVATADAATRAEAGRRTAELNVARAVLLALGRLPAPPAPPPPPAAAGSAAASRRGTAHDRREEPYAFPLAHDTLAVDAPAEEAFDELVAVGATLGDVLADRAASLVEVRARSDEGPVSILVSLQGRATGLTEAFVTLSDEEGAPLPWLATVVELLAERLNEAAGASR